jgi:hypothetical protein
VGQAAGAARVLVRASGRDVRGDMPCVGAAGLAVALFTNYFFADLIDRLEDQTYYMRYRWEFEDLSTIA